MSSLDHLPPFPGFRDAAFDFLKALAENNRREWFKPRKETYEDEVLWPLRCLVADAAREAALQGFPLTGHAKTSLFRIYRDTRFSKNKQPYKTHAGAVLSRSGDRKDQGALYIHIEPGNAFLAAGYWRPPSALLRTWRSHMVAHPHRFHDLLQQLEHAGLTLDSHRGSLKRMPRGFEAHADSDLADDLRRKSFTVSRAVPDDALRTPAFTRRVIQMMQDALPLLTYGWHLLDTTVPEG